MAPLRHQSKERVKNIRITSKAEKEQMLLCLSKLGHIGISSSIHSALSRDKVERCCIYSCQSNQNAEHSNCNRKHNIANQMDKNRKRAVFIIDKDDAAVLDDYAKKMGFTASVLLREATFRLAKELRETAKTTLLRMPKENEGHATPTAKKKDSTKMSQLHMTPQPTAPEAFTSKNHLIKTEDEKRNHRMFKSSPKVTLECEGTFRVTILAGNRVQIELDAVTGLPETAGDVLYDKRGVAERLGTTLRSIENWMIQKRHPLPYIRHCGRPKFRESDISWWLSQGCSLASRRVSAALGGQADPQPDLQVLCPPQKRRARINLPP